MLHVVVLMLAAQTPQAASAEPAPPSAATALAKECYQQVEQTANSKANMLKGAETCERAAKAPGATKKEAFDSWVNVARARLRTGDLLKGDDAVKHYELGRAAAAEAKKLEPESADAVFWDVANLASIGKAKGVMNSLFMVPEIKEGLNEALKRDPNHTYARETLAKVYHELPGMVGGDDDKAEELLLENLRRDPKFTPSMVVLAQLYIDQRRYPEARKWLQKVADMPSSDSSIPQDHWRFNAPDAKRLLKSIEGK